MFGGTRLDTVWLDLLNSDWHDPLGGGRTEDRLDNIQWLRRFASRWRLPFRTVCTRTARERLRGARKVMRRIVDSLVTPGRPSKADLAELNRLYAAPAVCGLEPSGAGYRWRTMRRGRSLDRLIGGIAASFADTLVHGDLSRINVCQNRACLWVFYDESRNRSRRWCDVKECGDLIRVRRHRERGHRQPPRTAPAAASGPPRRHARRKGRP